MTCFGPKGLQYGVVGTLGGLEEWAELGSERRHEDAMLAGVGLSFIASLHPRLQGPRFIHCNCKIKSVREW